MGIGAGESPEEAKTRELDGTSKLVCLMTGNISSSRPGSSRTTEDHRDHPSHAHCTLPFSHRLKDWLVMSAGRVLSCELGKEGNQL